SEMFSDPAGSVVEPRSIGRPAVNGTNDTVPDPTLIRFGTDVRLTRSAVSVTELPAAWSGVTVSRLSAPLAVRSIAPVPAVMLFVAVRFPFVVEIVTTPLFVVIPV